MLRDNFFYILLGLIAVVLIGVTIGLQMMLLSGRSPDPPAVSQSPSTMQSATTGTTESADGSGEQEVAMVINTPTSTPIVIAVQSDSNAPTSTPVEATSTALPPTVPPTLPPPTPASSDQTTPEQASPDQAPAAQASTAESVAVDASSVEVEPTVNVPPTQAPATATSIPVEPTSTPLLATDFVFGYIDGRAECTLFTYVIADLLETWGWSTRVVEFSSMNGIFDSTLYENNNAAQPDLTFCYRDPEDRGHFLSQNATDLELISSGYTKIGTQKYYILAHSSVPAQLRYENACMLNFFKSLEIDASSLSASSAVEWLDDNADLVQSWGTCEVSTN